MNDFAIRFHNLRIERGLTLEQLAEELNKRFNTSFTKSAFSKWENGRSDPSFQSIPMIAEFFGVSVDYLIGVEPSHKGITNEDKALLDRIHALDIYGRRIVETILEIELERLRDEKCRLSGQTERRVTK